MILQETRVQLIQQLLVLLWLTNGIKNSTYSEMTQFKYISTDTDVYLE